MEFCWIQFASMIRVEICEHLDHDESRCSTEEVDLGIQKKFEEKRVNETFEEPNRAIFSIII